MRPIVQLLGLTRRFGSLTAVDQVDLDFLPGVRHALIGPNGAGKSTLFATVAGTLRPTGGRITFAGRDVTPLSESARARLGLVRTYQHSSLFLGSTVLDNVAMAAQRVHKASLRPDRPARRFRHVNRLAEEHLAAMGLGDRVGDQASALSHGERRQLEVAMVLAAGPSVVMFDEPTAGMSAAETERFVRLLAGLPGHITVVIVEHDLDVVFRLASQVTVMHLGRVLASGAPEQIRADESVRRAYLGDGHD